MIPKPDGNLQKEWLGDFNELNEYERKVKILLQLRLGCLTISGGSQTSFISKGIRQDITSYCQL